MFDNWRLSDWGVNLVAVKEEGTVLLVGENQGVFLLQIAV
jgi:hypothetical protein